MAKNNRLSRDQKRKAKLKKRAERSHTHESLAYRGNKYKTEEYVGVVFATETGIYESYVMTDRTLSDDDVEATLEHLVLRMRQGPLPALEEIGPDPKETEKEVSGLLLWNIRRHWQTLAEREGLPRRDDLIGVLRTILNSLEIWRSKNMHSRGYLHYLEGFMKQAGIDVRRVGPDFEILPLDEEEEEDDALLELGRDWIEGEDQAEAAFEDAVADLLRAGDAERVVNVCQQLLGENTNMAYVPRLQAFAIRGHQALNR